MQSVFWFYRTSHGWAEFRTMQSSENDESIVRAFAAELVPGALPLRCFAFRIEDPALNAQPLGAGRGQGIRFAGEGCAQLLARPLRPAMTLLRRSVLMLFHHAFPPRYALRSTRHQL